MIFVLGRRVACSNIIAARATPPVVIQSAAASTISEIRCMLLLALGSDLR
jgi:hypothetical protein